MRRVSLLRVRKQVRSDRYLKSRGPYPEATEVNIPPLQAPPDDDFNVLGGIYKTLTLDYAPGRALRFIGVLEPCSIP